VASEYEIDKKFYKKLNSKDGARPVNFFKIILHTTNYEKFVDY